MPAHLHCLAVSSSLPPIRASHPPTTLAHVIVVVSLALTLSIYLSFFFLYLSRTHSLSLVFFSLVLANVRACVPTGRVRPRSHTQCHPPPFASLPLPYVYLNMIGVCIVDCTASSVFHQIVSSKRICDDHCLSVCRFDHGVSERGVLTQNLF